MIHMRGLLLALLLALPWCDALQLSPIMPALTDIFNPVASTAQSLLAMRQASTAHKRLFNPSGKFAVQLGADHPELAPIVEALDDMLAQLEAQDHYDAELLNNKTAIHTAAASATHQVNATLAVKQDEYTSASANCESKTETASNDKTSHEQDVSHCDSELSYIHTMKTALSSLKLTGAMESVQIMSNLADKITTGSAVDKAPFKNVNLLGRDYGTDSAHVDAAIATLEQKINERKKAAEDAITMIMQEKASACDSADAAQGQVVLYELRQREAIAQEGASYADLMTMTSTVEQSRLENQRIRDSIAVIKTKIQELAAIPPTASIQKMPSSMLQMRMGNFEDIVESIKTLLRNIHTRIDTEAAAETSAKQVKLDIFEAAQTEFYAQDEILVVLSSNSTTIANRLAAAQGSKDAAKAALDEETAHQLHETTMFNEMRTLLTTLAGQGAEASALATAPSKAMLALALGAERSHEDLITRFEDLIATLEREMQSKRSQLQVTYDGHFHDWQVLTQAHADHQETLDEAQSARDQMRLHMMQADVQYVSASSRLDANNLVRQSERDLITRLLELVDELKA